MIELSKQLEQQRFIFKIHSARLRAAKWDLTLPLQEARKNDEVISLASSQILRWIDEMNGIKDSDAMARDIKLEIRRLKREPSNLKNRKDIRALYTKLDEIQFKPDYMSLIIDKPKDYQRACKGFSINGVKYVRLLGTTGGIKNSTIVFVSERLAPELRRRIENGRASDKELVPAKLEAYKALTCSASIPVSMPKGVLVVSDVFTKFASDIIYLTDEDEGEPRMELKKNYPIELDASDGFGLMLPQLAARWSAELGLSYMMSGCNIRMSFTKGMVFTFDFLDFAENVANNYTVKDVWGNDVDITTVELILTESMVKLWDSYKDCESFLKSSMENDYTFGVTKTCPATLENERMLNYQFIQPFDLNDDEIEALIEPTISEIRDVLGGDWRKTVLFLKGMGLNEKNIAKQEDDFAKAIMIDQRVMDDPYIQNKIYRLIKNRINEAKVGVIKVHGNYSIVSGDPYALCQHIFGLEVTGLLGAGEIYNRYWVESDAKELIGFRAPMSCANNIRKLVPKRDRLTDYWYQFMRTCTIINAWDTTMIAMNGINRNLSLCQ